MAFARVREWQLLGLGPGLSLGLGPEHWLWFGPGARVREMAIGLGQWLR